MGLEAFLPFVLSLAVSLFFAYELRKRHTRLEELKAKNARLHSTQRAHLAAKYFNNDVEVEVSGVLPDDQTLLIGYRKLNTDGVGLFPGERVKNETYIEGTIIAWPKSGTNGTVDVLNKWVNEQTKVRLRVNDGGELLIISDPVKNETVAIEIIPGD